VILTPPYVLMMESVGSSDMLGHTTLCHIPEGSSFCNHHCENFRCQM